MVTMDKNHVTETITLVILINNRRFNLMVAYRPPYDHNSELFLNSITDILNKLIPIFVMFMVNCAYNILYLKSMGLTDGQ